MPRRFRRSVDEFVGDHFIAVDEDYEEQEEDDDEEEDDDDEEEEEEEVAEEQEEADYADDSEVEEVFVHNPRNSAVMAPRVSEIEVRGKDDAVMVDSVPSSSGRDDDGEGEGCLNREEFEGLICSICLEPWTSSGEHQPSCLSCGHLFGMSCIKKWLGQRRNSGKCPQCNKKCTLKDVRRIYGSRVVVVDEESQKRIRFLEAKCDSLAKKDEEWRKKEVEWHMKVLVLQKKDEESCQKLQQANERVNYLERSIAEMENKSQISAATDGFHQSAGGPKSGLVYLPVSYHTFDLQQELVVDGARHFDVDDTGQMLIMARKLTRGGESHVLTKMSLVSPHEQDNVLLPSAVRDLHLSSFARLALLVSTGRKLSVFSMESNNCVVDYDLPAAAWSCSWDSNSSHYVYAGLQNGKLLVFDLRNTGGPVESRNGLTCNPIHTIYSLLEDSPAHTGVKKLLTASQVGVCEWSIGGENEEPSLLADTANQGICVSLAHCPSSDNIVATFRPKVKAQDEPDDPRITQVSQVCPSFSLGNPVQGSQVFMQRVNSRYQKFASIPASVPSIRLPKSAIFGMGDGAHVFACGDEATSDLVLRGLSSLTIDQRLPSYYPIRDVKYATSTKPSLLCCLSQEKLQLFTQKLS